MEIENKQIEDLGAFLKVLPTKDDDAPLPRTIIKDLVVSKTKLAAVYLAGSVAGYLLTLAICAQRSVGLSPLAWKTASLFHRMPDTWCAPVCGAIFGVAPFLASVVLLTRFQHRCLLFHMTWLLVLVPIAASAIMTATGTPHSWTWQGPWILAAVVTPYLLEGLCGIMLRQSKWGPVVV